MRYVKAGGAEGGAFDPTRRVSYRPGAGAHRWVRMSEPTPVDSDFCLLHYKMFKDAAGKTLKSILVSCNTRMEPFAIPQVRELVSFDEMELDRLGDPGERRAIFAVMSDTSSLYSFLFAIMMWQTMNILCKRAIKLYGGALPVPVVMLMDEFANIGRLPDVEKMVAVVRSRNISMAFGLQSLSQLKSAYKDDAATIIDCCDTTLFLGGKSTDTVKEIAEAIGKETVAIVTWNESRGASASSTRNWNTIERDLMQPAEVAKLPRDTAIVLIAGTDPLKDRKYDISTHPRWHSVYPGHEGALYGAPSTSPTTRRGGVAGNEVRRPRPWAPPCRFRASRPVTAGRRDAKETGIRPVPAKDSTRQRGPSQGHTRPREKMQRRYDPNVGKHHQPRLGMRDVPGGVPRRMGSRQPGTGHPRAAGRRPDRERHINHRRRRHHHRGRRLLRHARHELAPGVRGRAC